MTGAEEEKKEVANSTEEIEVKQNEPPQEPLSEKPQELLSKTDHEPKRGISTEGVNFKCKKCGYSWKPRKKHVLKPKCPLCGSFKVETVESVEIEKVKPVKKPKPKTHIWDGIAEVKAIAEEEKDDVDDEIKELLEEGTDKPKGIKGWIWVGVAIFVLGLISLFFFQTRKESSGNSVSRTQKSHPQIIYDIHPPGVR
ncbi:MAG: hypothetical protein QFX36_04060 [Archaeoglobales archaeon]|nr:hypothetical protein [Archaeoglobales archaeon]